MRKTAALWSIIVLGLLLTAVAPFSMGATKDTPVEFGKEYTISGTTTVRWRIDVCPGDNITINVSKVVSYYAYVNLDPALNYTASSNDTLMNLGGTTPSGLLSPFVLWFTCAHTQLVWLEFKTEVLASSPSMTYNITKVNGTSGDALAEIAKLNQSLAQLNATVASLNASLANLTSAFLANLSLINSTLNAIQNYIAYLNGSLAALNTTVYGMNVSLRAEIAAQIAALNASLSQADSLLKALSEANDTALRALLDSGDGALNNSLHGLGMLVASLRSDLNNITFPTPDNYNDTPIWREIARLNATPPVTIVEMNNTTLVNTTLVNTTEVYPTNYTIVNQTHNVTNNVTKTIEKPAQNEAGVAAGVVAGTVSGTAAGIVVGRRRKGEPEMTP
jgi:hypothetical protein